MRGLILPAAIFLAGCAPRLDADGRTALERYRSLCLRTDAAGLAALFAEEAEVSHGTGAPIRGRAAIRAFLEGFRGVTVTRYELGVESTRRDGPHTLQQGTYTQTTRTPEGRLLETKGTFEATWRRRADGAWELVRMHTENR